MRTIQNESDNKNKNYKEIGTYTSYSFIGEILRYVLLMVTSILITNLFGAETYGEYSFVLSFMIILVTIAKLGFMKSIVYFIPKAKKRNNSEQLKSIISYSYLIVIISGTTLCIIIMLFSKTVTEIIFNNKIDSQLILFMSPIILIESIYEHSLAIFRGLKEIAVSVLIKNIAVYVIRLVAILSLFFFLRMQNTYGLIYSTYFTYIVIMIFNVLKQYKAGYIGRIRHITRKEQIEIISYSVPLLMTSIMYILLRNVDILMIGYLNGSENVALYKVSIQICAIIPFFFRLTETFFSPMISTLFHEKKLRQVKQTYVVITKWSFTFGIFFFSIITLLRIPILGAFGSEFISASKALVLVGIGSLSSVIVGPVNNMHAMTGKPRYTLITSIISLCLNILLNLFLIPRYGINGAAVATLIATMIGRITSLLILYLTQKIQPFSIDFIKPFFSAIISYLIISLIKVIFPLEGSSV